MFTFDLWCHSVSWCMRKTTSSHDLTWRSWDRREHRNKTARFCVSLGKMSKGCWVTPEAVCVSRDALLDFLCHKWLVVCLLMCLNVLVGLQGEVCVCGCLWGKKNYFVKSCVPSWDVRYLQCGLCPNWHGISFAAASNTAVSSQWVWRAEPEPDRLSNGR